MAQKLSHQLRRPSSASAIYRLKWRGIGERAEQWLHRVYTEIKDRFLRQENNCAQIRQYTYSRRLLCLTGDHGERARKVFRQLEAVAARTEFVMAIAYDRV